MVSVRLRRLARVDVLLVIDSSASMAGKQARFAQALERAEPLVATWGSVHLATVTTDLGAGDLQLGGCRPGGDRATLRAVGAAAAGCPGVRGSGDGSGYLDLDFSTGKTNLAGGTIAAALACAVNAGTAGCAFEQPLEAARRALLDHLPGGSAAADGFLRPDALLLVLFVTDEDDCSASADAGGLFDPRGGSLGPLTSFRCPMAGLRSGLPPRPLPRSPSGGPLPMISATAAGPLESPQTYLDLFTAPGALKADANDVLLAAFSGPAEPVEVVAAPLALEPGPDPAGPACDGGATCAPALRHGCVAAADPSRFADPAPRLLSVVSAASHHYRASLCEDDPQQALADLAALVQAREAGDGCLATPLLDPAHPSCQVADLTTVAGRTSERPITACGPATPPPCWRIVEDRGCAAIADPRTGLSASLRLAIDRGGLGVPDGVVTSAGCLGP